MLALSSLISNDATPQNYLLTLPEAPETVPQRHRFLKCFLFSYLFPVRARMKNIGVMVWRFQDSGFSG
jgi:hypothetical protein